MIITKHAVRRDVPYDVELRIMRGCILTARARAVAVVHESPTIARAVLMVLMLDGAGVSHVRHDDDSTLVAYACGAEARSLPPHLLDGIYDMAWLPENAEEWLVERVRRHVRGELTS